MTSNLRKRPVGRLELIELAFTDIGPETVQAKLLLLPRLDNERESQKVLKRNDHRFPLKRAKLLVFGQRLVNTLKSWAKNVHPPTNKTVLGLQLGSFVVAHGVASGDAAAIRVTDHDQMRHMKRRHRVFDGSRSAMRIAVRFVGRHKVRDISMNKELTRIGTEDRSHVNPAVTAGDHHPAWTLALVGKFTIPGLVLGKTRRLPAMIPLDKEARKRTYLIHRSLIKFKTISAQFLLRVNRFFLDLGLHRDRVEGKGTNVSENVIVLCPSEVISIEPPAMLPGGDPHVLDDLLPFAEDAVEDMVVCLAGIEAAWASGEFKRLGATLLTIIDLSQRTGLKDVAFVASEACNLVESKDEVALAAVIARLVRVGEASLATLLEFSYRQI